MHIHPPVSNFSATPQNPTVMFDTRPVALAFHQTTHSIFKQFRAAHLRQRRSGCRGDVQPAAMGMGGGCVCTDMGQDV